MSHRSYIPADNKAKPTVTVIHDEAGGFVITAESGNTFEAVRLVEPTWGEITAYYEVGDKTKYLPPDKYVVEVKESTIIPSGAKLVVFPIPESMGMPKKLWTLYFPPVVPGTNDEHAPGTQPAPALLFTKDEKDAAVVEKSSLEPIQVRPRLMHPIGEETQKERERGRRTFPALADEKFEEMWQGSTLGGLKAGVPHWQDDDDDETVAAAAGKGREKSE
ncbi:hypothetical protein BDZ90DRAFT_262496 [Jaminaea rosea]|uniref:Uncharacterized protein n=1 Tax=Jaminaea rosea TaxID=1569628 RepID=A0A316UM49_9BASI|nr:hypothetical protein BDZ90DRAFT_262496 [Jaminaea rosea]PWN25451.1 hypothetical protein BDZ90DRAFT_262496 [Jaminaea rosea]